MRKLRATLCFLAGCVAIATPAFGRPWKPASPRVEQLQALGELWTAIDLFHPALATPAIDWDSVFVASVEAVGDGGDESRTIAAAERMLSGLFDPVTRVERQMGALSVHERTTVDEILVVTIDAGVKKSNADHVTIERIHEHLRAAKGAILEIDAPTLPETLLQQLLAPPSTRDGVWMPPQKVRKYSGFPNEGTTGTRAYTHTWHVIGVNPIPTVPEALPPLVFLVRRGAAVPAAAAFLQAAGRCEIVTEPGSRGPERTWQLPLPGGATAFVRTATLLGPGFRPDSFESSQAALESALARLRARMTLPHPTPRIAAAPDPSASEIEGRVIPARERRYESGWYPDAAHRVLAAVRIWRTIDAFFPYKSLMETNWDDAFRHALPRIEAARDSTEYAIAISELCTFIGDSHVRVSGGAASEYLGRATPLVRTRIIEGVPIVAQVLEDSLLEVVQVGDEILAVDGERAAARIARLERVIPSSTRQALRAVVGLHFLAGAPRSVARLVLRGADSRQREVQLRRMLGDPRSTLGQRGGDVIKIMPGNVGYVDLDRLTTARVKELFERLKDTQALVLDMRGYPRGGSLQIGPRLAREPSPVMAVFHRRELDSPDPAAAGEHQWEQRLAAATGDRYTKPTFMLVDERSISAAEHTGLSLEVANDTQFVGSKTMGANGDVTSLVVPGDLTISFTGQGVTHADGRRLQRVGLVPHVAIEPTRRGIRAGRDEVLQRALLLAGGTGAVASDVDPPVDFVLYSTALAPLPKAWALRLMTMTDFQSGMDREIAHAGRASGSIRSIVRRPESRGALDQSIRSDLYRGKRLRLAAQVRTRDAPAGATLFVRVMAATRQLAIAESGGKSLAGSRDWTLEVAEVDVPDLSVGITFGLAMDGPGQAWIDDVAISVMGDAKASISPDPNPRRAFDRPFMPSMYSQLLSRPEALGFE